MTHQKNIEKLKKALQVAEKNKSQTSKNNDEKSSHNTSSTPRTGNCEFSNINSA